jgi:hypothetical protein
MCNHVRKYVLRRGKVAHAPAEMLSQAGPDPGRVPGSKIVWRMRGVLQRRKNRVMTVSASVVLVLTGWMVRVTGGEASNHCDRDLRLGLLGRGIGRSL